MFELESKPIHLFWGVASSLSILCSMIIFGHNWKKLTNENSIYRDSLIARTYCTFKNKFQKGFGHIANCILFGPYPKTSIFAIIVVTKYGLLSGVSSLGLFSNFSQSTTTMINGPWDATHKCHSRFIFYSIHSSFNSWLEVKRIEFIPDQNFNTIFKNKSG